MDTLSPKALAARNERLSRDQWRVGVFIAAHVPLALAMHAAPDLGTAHAMVVLLYGLYVALSTKDLAKIANFVAYVVGCEVLWRTTKAGVFWEFSKYAAALLCFVGVMRTPIARRYRVVSLLYVALLLPSSVMTFSVMDLDNARQQVSFNLSGPLALGMCVWFFANVRLTQDDIRKVFYAIIGPAVGIAFLSFFTIATEEVTFNNESNILAAGGFGPNQVSAILGLAVLFIALLLFDRKLRWSIRLPMIAVGGFLLVQAALTFSRGGLFLSLAGLFGALLYLLRDARSRLTLLFIGGALFALGDLVAVPLLDDFTDGALSKRFEKSGTSGRDRLAAADLQIFSDNPILGVGPGMAFPIRHDLGFGGAAHTEYTRLLSEHGILGLLAIAAILSISIRTVLDASTASARSYVMALVVWALGFMAVNAMRLAAPSFILGLACTVAYSSQPRPPPRRA